jgi:hypothetical protein
VEGQLVRLSLSWRAEPHLSIKKIDGVSYLVLNVTTLVRGAAWWQDWRYEPGGRWFDVHVHDPGTS